jgi:AraC-like DNA-binding protein
MTEKAISPLRRRLIEDMTIRRLGPGTQHEYIRHVKKLCIGPRQFLPRRRLHLAKRALQEAKPDATTVTAIATKFGFWELGQFAVVYRSSFAPSVTLSRS